MVDAVILAGGTIPDSEADFRAAVSVPCKSLIRLLNRIIVGWVVDSLKAAERIGRVVVVGPAELADHPDCAAADLVLEESTGRSENLFLGLDALSDAEAVLMMTSDIPLATGAMIDDLLACFGPEIELGWTYVALETVLADCADRPPPPLDDQGRQMPNWVSLKLRDGRLTGTPCLYLKPDAIRRIQPFIKGIFDDREMGNVIRVMRPVFGLPFLIRMGLVLKYAWLGGLLSVADIERRVERGLGLRCATYCSPPELAFDVDHATDVPIAERVLSQRSSG